MTENEFAGSTEYVNDETVLKVEGLNASYGETKILHQVSLEVKKGELVALVGPNGAGKTTTLRSISGIIRQKDGEIIFDGKKVSNLPANTIASMGLSLVPEGRGLFAGMSVRENLEMGAFTKRARSQMKRTLEEVYSLFPVLKDRANQQAGSLSGGEQQMLAIGRAIMSRPSLLLLQNLHAALDIADRAYLLENGRIVLNGSASEFKNNPQIRESYLGL